MAKRWRHVARDPSPYDWGILVLSAVLAGLIVGWTMNDLVPELKADRRGAFESEAQTEAIIAAGAGNRAGGIRGGGSTSPRR